METSFIESKKKDIGVLGAFALSLGTSIGGDEFVVILEGEDYLNRDSLIKKLKLASTENTKTDNGIVIAVGMAVNQGGEEFTEVFRRADTLMYKNKKSLKVKRPSHNLR